MKQLGKPSLGKDTYWFLLLAAGKCGESGPSALCSTKIMLSSLMFVFTWKDVSKDKIYSFDMKSQNNFYSIHICYYKMLGYFSFQNDAILIVTVSIQTFLLTVFFKFWESICIVVCICVYPLNNLFALYTIYHMCLVLLHLKKHFIFHHKNIVCKLNSHFIQ